jgi:hypothetical protein
LKAPSPYVASFQITVNVNLLLAVPNPPGTLDHERQKEAVNAGLELDEYPFRRERN